MAGNEKRGTTVYNKLVTVAVAFGSLVRLNCSLIVPIQADHV